MNALRFLMVMALSLVFTAASHAVSIGINFNSHRSTTANLLPAELAGAPGFAQVNWNNTGQGGNAQTNASGSTANIISPIAGTLVDSTGAATAATVRWTSNGTWNTSNGTATPDAKLMNGYIDAINPGGFSTVTIGSIPYSVYDIVVYFGSDGNGRTGDVTDGTTTYSYTTFSNDPFGGGGFVPGDYVQTLDVSNGHPNSNYAVFSGVTTATVNILRGSANSGIHGIQIIDRTPLIPEPATIGLFGLAGAVVLLRRRR